MVMISGIYPHAGYVEIVFEGTAERGFPHLTAHIQAVADACQTHQCDHVLCDYSAVEYKINTDILGEHLLAETLQNVGLVKLAVLPPNSTTAAQLPPHLENAARNRGVNLLVFLTRAEAIEWLLDHK